MRYLIAAVLSVIVCAARPAAAVDYILKFEKTTVVESKLGDDKPVKTSDVRTMEILITPKQRFHGKTTWENQRLMVKGKLKEEKDGTLRLDLDCTHSIATAPPGNTDGGDPIPEIENRTRCNTTLGVKLGAPLTFGGFGASQTTETPEGSRSENRMTTFRVTLIEDADGE